MTFCPICKSEYKDGITECEDCEVELVDKLYEETEPEFECRHCGENLKKDDEFCRNCGILFDKNVKCVKHPVRQAEAVCLICRKYLCEECLEEMSKKYLCIEHSDYTFTESNWAVIYTTNQEWDGEMRKDYLNKHNIPSLIDSKKDSSRIFTSGILAEIRLLVPLILF